MGNLRLKYIDLPKRITHASQSSSEFSRGIGENDGLTSPWTWQIGNKI